MSLNRRTIISTFFKCKENKGINIYVNICCFKTARC